MVRFHCNARIMLALLQGRYTHPAEFAEIVKIEGFDTFEASN
jgi:hypothetical protein